MKTTIDFFCIAISYLRVCLGEGRGGAKSVVMTLWGGKNKIHLATEESRSDQSESETI